MAEHYTKGTVEVKKFCRKCGEFTMHYVMGGRLGSCQACVQRLAEEAKKPKQTPAAEQTSMF